MKRFLSLVLALLLLVTIPASSISQVIIVSNSDGHLSASTDFYGYDINYSCRFDDDGTAYLYRVPAGAGNRKTFSISLWFKLGNLGIDRVLIGAANGGSGNDLLYLGSDNKLHFTFGNASSGNYVTTQVFRDPAAWHHLFVSVDTANRDVKFYLSGTQITAFDTATLVTADYSTGFNGTGEHRIGRHPGATDYFDGGMSEIIVVDGDELAYTLFGELKYGVWIPAEYTGAYGTNGFRLNFSNSAALGTDSSGNGNNFTTSGLAVTDQLTDTPTNNFCTWNPLWKGVAAHTFTEGNLFTAITTANTTATYSTFALPQTGKWYWEVKFISSSNYNFVTGVQSMSTHGNNVPYFAGGGWGITDIPGTGNWFKYYGAAGSDLSVSKASNDKLMFAYDADSGYLWFGVNGTWTASGDPATGANPNYTGVTGSDLAPFVGHSSGASQTTSSYANFGQDSAFVVSGNADGAGYGNFEYTVPTGFRALCSRNLPAQSLFTAYTSCATENETGQLAYTGNGSADGPFIFTGGPPSAICVDGTEYTAASTADFDFLSNGIKLRSATEKNTNATAYTLEYWLSTEYADDFKYSNAQVN